MRKKHLYAQLLLLTILLGIHNGRVAMWKDQDPEPIRVFPYSAAALPPHIREALQQGVRIDSQEDLQQILEKFFS